MNLVSAPLGTIARDNFGRPVDSLRVSVTLRCNHSCVFCHMEGIKGGSKLKELSPGDYGFLSSSLRKLGVRNYKLTGGEPLIRRDIVDIISEIRPKAYEVSIVTNGSLLKHYAKGLAEAGLDRMNVSLHSLREEVFNKITGGRLKPVLEGIDEALNYGHIIKLDYVFLRWNSQEFRSLIDYATQKGLDINIIELIPIGMDQEKYSELVASVDPVMSYLERISVRIEVNPFQNRPIYYLPQGNKAIVIKGYGNPYLCAGCTRLRMTPDGKFKTCIFINNNLVSAWDHIKNRDEEGLKQAFLEAVKRREPYFKFVNKKNDLGGKT